MDETLDLVLYGSMMKKENLEEYFPDSNYFQAEINGFKRVFNTPADRRSFRENKKAVLNVERAEDSEINAVIVKDIDLKSFGKVSLRETSYRTIKLSKEQIDVRNSVELNDEALIFGEAENKQGIEPIPEYLELCVEAAFEHGEEFGETFLETTFTAQGEKLSSHTQ